jgi:antitoxin MazE
MTTAIRTHIIKIGNSQGIRIPKVLLDQSALSDEVELEVREGQIVIRPVRATRAGWEEQFQAMRVQADDRLLDEDFFATTWDEEEWEW